uniref:RING-type E3 ubiquitin transferase n=1 Tax=Cairina moschata TaxID=8855 RepID=A0A8C3CSR6_CAIMO
AAASGPGSASMAAALDTRCPICLDTWGSPTFTMPCCHQFCLPCIPWWADTKPECPLCKRRLTSIEHGTTVPCGAPAYLHDLPVSCIHRRGI